MQTMSTDGGEHPMSYWADTTSNYLTDTLIAVREESESRQADIARRVKMQIKVKLYDTLLKHYEAVQKAEQEHLTANIKTVEQIGEHLMKPLEPLDAVTPMMDDIHAIFAETPFKTHFAQDHVKVILQNIVAQHTADVMHLERRYHADRLNQGA